MLAMRDGSTHHAQPVTLSKDIEAASRIYQANFAALHAYKPQPCRLPVTDIRTTRTQHALDNETYAGRPISPLSEECSIVMVPGDHDSIFSPDHLADLAHAVNATLIGDDMKAETQPR